MVYNKTFLNIATILFAIYAINSIKQREPSFMSDIYIPKNEVYKNTTASITLDPQKPAHKRDLAETITYYFFKDKIDESVKKAGFTADNKYGDKIVYDFEKRKRNGEIITHATIDYTIGVTPVPEYLKERLLFAKNGETIEFSTHEDGKDIEIKITVKEIIKSSL